MRAIDETPGTRRLYAEYRQEVHHRTDRMFLWLLLLQWLAAIVTALWSTPAVWNGSLFHLPPLVTKAFMLGGAIASLLIYVAGGHFEMRYVVFASLAFLAMYRDTKVLLLASLITTVDHVLGCFLWPTSLY